MKIAVINLLRFGDVLQTVPFIKALWDFPHVTEVTLVCDRLDISVLKKLNLISRIINIDIKFIITELKKSEELPLEIGSSFDNLPRNYFDKCFVLNSLSVAYNIGHFITKSPDNIYGFNPDNKLDSLFGYLFDISLNKKISTVNLSELYLTYLDKPNPDKVVTLKKDNHFKMIGINVSTGDEVREFPAEFFINLTKLLSKDYKICLFGTINGSARDVYEYFGDRSDVSNFIGRTTTLELFDFMERLDLFISPDTGSIHLAALAGIRILGLYNISAYNYLTGAYSNNSYFLTPNIECYPCEEHYQPCGDIKCKNFYTPEKIIHTVNHILNGHRVDNLANLNLVKYQKSDIGLFPEFIYGKKLSDEILNIMTVTKSLIFKNKKEIQNVSPFWQELSKILNIYLETGYSTDIKRFIKNSDYSFLNYLIK